MIEAMVQSVVHEQKRPAISASRTLTNPMTVNNLENSRGGTRTRDPGIMSAVL